MVAEQKQEMAEEERIAYYPGCSLHGTAREFDESVREVADLLGIKLLELPDWNCCGASSAHMTDHGLAVELGARNIRIAEKTGLDELLVPCAACFHRLKAAWKAMKAEAEERGKAPPRVRVIHLGEWLRARPAMEKIRTLLKRPLQGLKLVPYYGCLITRPPAVTDSDEHEDPKSMDLLIRLLGGEFRRWSYKTECCGGSLTLGRSDITAALVSRIVRAAAEAGAQGIVTMCPMCHANLESNQLDLKKGDPAHPTLPIFYATELVAACCAESPQRNRWKSHLIDPAGVVAPLGL